MEPSGVAHRRLICFRACTKYAGNANVLPLRALYIIRALSYSNLLYLYYFTSVLPYEFPQPDYQLYLDVTMKPLLELAEQISYGIPSHYHVDLENRLAIAWGGGTKT